MQQYVMPFSFVNLPKRIHRCNGQVSRLSDCSCILNASIYQYTDIKKASFYTCTHGEYLKSAVRINVFLTFPKAYIAICKYCYSPNKISGFSTPFPSQTHRSSDRDLLGRECDAAVLLLLLIVRRGKNIRNIYKHQCILVCTISSKSSGGEYFHPLLSSHTFLFYFLVTPKGV